MISSRNVANPTVNIKSKLISQILPRRVVCFAIARWAWSAMIVESEPVPHSRDSSPGLSQPVKRTASSSSSCSDVAFMTGLCRHRAGYPRAFPCQCLSEWFIFREGDRPQNVELECEQFFELTWSYVPPKLCGTVPNSVPQFILKKLVLCRIPLLGTLIWLGSGNNVEGVWVDVVWFERKNKFLHMFPVQVMLASWTKSKQMRKF